VRVRSLLSASVAVVTATATASVLAVAAPAISPAHAASRGQRQSADSGPAVYHDVSRPLRDMPLRAISQGKQRDEDVDAMPQSQSSKVADPVVQSSVTRLMPSANASFEGLGSGLPGFAAGYVPPDPNSAVGPSQIVETVNAGFAVFNKSGGVVYGPSATNSLWSGFGGYCASTDDGDAVVRYDRAAGRWLISQFANFNSSTGPYFECVAVSQTGDATGAYYRYAFQYSNKPDYPKLAVWPDAYYATYNMFSPSGSRLYGEDCAFNRSAMLSGGASTQQCYTTSSSYGGLLPADLDSAAQPPSGTPDLAVALGTTSTTLAYWNFHVDWANSANSTFTGPSNLTVASYSQSCGGHNTCVPQYGTSQQLASLGDRMMFRLAYRNLGDHESFVVTHSVVVGSRIGVRWYELRLANRTTPYVYQQGTFSPDTSNRWMGSAAMDKEGDVAVGYSVSSSSMNPAIRYAGRLWTDALGTLAQGESTLISGSGSQTGSYADRWGDYTSMSVDPTDDCTFWYTNEYLTSYSTSWHTRIGSFSFPGCSGPLSAGLSCANNDDGTFHCNATPMGGTPPYTASWSGSGVSYNSTSASNASGSCTSGIPDTASVTIYDSAGASVSRSATFDCPAPLSADVSCYGTGDSVFHCDLSTSGGTPPYTVQWSGQYVSFSYTDDVSADGQCATLMGVTVNVFVTDSGGANASPSYSWECSPAP